MRTFHLWRLTITVWWWQKADKRQRKATTGCGFIVEFL
jgi:hypothetical protein